ncbi:MAG: hypothetical protein HUJ25_00430 [Crocinitomicaceae bacterium]|nr:hypothetical protein [Crocinitomicaceae bacterium]
MKLLIRPLALGLVALGSCKKYDNGGSKAKAEKNIKNTWTIGTYYFDGTDATSQLLISNYEETYGDDGVYTRSYTDGNGDAQSETGTWSLVDDKDRLNISGTGSYELTAQTSTVSTSDYDLLKLTKDELWYAFDNGGNNHEFHMVPK